MIYEFFLFILVISRYLLVSADDNIFNMETLEFSQKNLSKPYNDIAMNRFKISIILNIAISKQKIIHLINIIYLQQILITKSIFIFFR